MNNYTKFIDFLKRHDLYNQEIFKYIEENIERFDEHYNELMLIRGIYYNYNDNEELKNFKLCVPYIDNEKTAFLNLGPYIKAIHAYPKLGKKYKQNAEIEIIVMYYEKLFISETKNKELERYLNNIISTIKKENTERKYKITVKALEELEGLEKDTNYKKIKSKAKKLSIKHYHR